MSKRSESMQADELENRWYVSASTTNATIVPAVSPTLLNTRAVRHLDFLHLAILNKNTLHTTASAQVRDASVGGTVLFQLSMLVGGSTTAQVNPAGIHLMATPGKEFFYTTDTVAPSVTVSVSAGGWTDESSSY